MSSFPAAIGFVYLVPTKSTGSCLRKVEHDSVFSHSEKLLQGVSVVELVLFRSLLGCVCGLLGSFKCVLRDQHRTVGLLACWQLTAHSLL